MDIDRSAPVIVELATIVDAPLETIWELHTAVDEWTVWHPEITRARLTGPLAVGGSFEWETAGLAITSVVGELEPLRRIAWSGPAHGIDGVHVWTFEQNTDGVAVHTAESWAGEPVLADPTGLQAALTASLTAWLAALKATAESIR
ncbi:SRPBCC family protein [Micromonospora sp. NBC_01699]|uniref:SRPBCC family protein n=1 Tax=Micromonospora sp. NBC_01699 TaxID=2975984 RepID=UPI002E368438|nr:SRPBCC family protein [Micromonospora sp. NBC_01699]